MPPEPWRDAGRYVEKRAMKTRRVTRILLAAVAAHLGHALPATAQCCLNDLFAGCGACFRRAPVYAVAPVAAPVVAPIAAPPPPVMVPVQQTSYVPETTYRTQYQNVPVTTYKPSCEIDPCTGCTRECMQPVTQYVQQAVNVPVTQYRAVTTTKYVQMQPGYGAPAAAAPPAFAAPPGAVAAPPAASAFAAPVQTTPQAWGAAGADVPQQLIPGAAPPALPPGTVPQQTYQPSYQQPITPQAGTYQPAAPQMMPQPQPSAPPPLAPTPTITPTPSLKPIPEMPRATATPAPTTAPAAPATSAGQTGAPALAPIGGGYSPSTGATAPAPTGTNGLQAPVIGPRGMPVLPGEGPKASTNAFPRLLEPTSHTTSWQPAMIDGSVTGRRPGYPTAALPSRLQQ
jgi:hypothetical protein